MGLLDTVRPILGYVIAVAILMKKSLLIIVNTHSRNPQLYGFG